MLRRFLASAIACAVFGAASLTAFAAAGNSSQSGQNSSAIKYIHSDISEKMMTYGIYEEIFANQIVFYSNIANGAMSKNPVKLDLPKTVMVSMEKDGENVEYTHGEEISEPGRYVLTLKVNGADLMGGSQGDIYYGLFRFWIVQEEESKPNNNSGTSDTSDEPSEPDTSSTPETSDNPDNTDNPENPSGGENENPPDSQDNTNHDELKGETEIPFAVGSANLLKQYASSTRIRIQTERGIEFYTNVPAGMKTTRDVEFTFIDSVTCKLIKNGQEVQYRVGSKIQEKGDYTLQIFDGGTENPATFSFSVIGSAVNLITEYSVPESCKIENATFNGIDIRTPENNIELGAEGKYTFRVACGNYTFDEAFTLDNVPPEFSLIGVDEEGEAHSGKVSIELLSDDIDHYDIMLNGELLTKKSVELTEPGVYMVTVYDKAGNSTAKTFEILYRMDGMAIVTVVLLIAVVVAGVVFFIMTRRKFIIR